MDATGEMLSISLGTSRVHLKKQQIKNKFKKQPYFLTHIRGNAHAAARPVTFPSRAWDRLINEEGIVGLHFITQLSLRPPLMAAGWGEDCATWGRSMLPAASQSRIMHHKDNADRMLLNCVVSCCEWTHQHRHAWRGKSTFLCDGQHLAEDNVNDAFKEITVPNEEHFLPAK